MPIGLGNGVPVPRECVPVPGIPNRYTCPRPVAGAECFGPLRSGWYSCVFREPQSGDASGGQKPPPKTRPRYAEFHCRESGEPDYILCTRPVEGLPCEEKPDVKLWRCRARRTEKTSNLSSLVFLGVAILMVGLLIAKS